MKSPMQVRTLFARLATAMFLAVGATTVSADNKATTLKDAYKDDFHIGVAINRTIATGTPVRADNVNRSHSQVMSDTAVVRGQFNQVSPENDLKWQLIHPSQGPDGYDFGPADAFVNFGLSNKMYIVGHTWCGTARHLAGSLRGRIRHRQLRTRLVRSPPA
jgi:endo-1,4-beta-xylanase